MKPIYRIVKLKCGHYKYAIYSVADKTKCPHCGLQVKPVLVSLS